MAICVSMYFIYMKPTYSVINQRQAKFAEYENVLSKVKEIKTKRDDLSSKYSNISQSDLDRMSKMIPKNFVTENYVNEISAIAVTHGMKISKIGVFVPVPSDQNAPSTDFEGGIVTITSKFTVTGTYDQFLSFLKDLETSLRLIDVTGLAAKAHGADSKSKEQDGFIDYTIDASTYALK